MVNNKKRKGADHLANGKTKAPRRTGRLHRDNDGPEDKDTSINTGKRHKNTGKGSSSGDTRKKELPPPEETAAESESEGEEEGSNDEDEEEVEEEDDDNVGWDRQAGTPNGDNGDNGSEEESDTEVVLEKRSNKGRGVDIYDHAKELPVANTNGRRNVPLQVVEAGSSAVPSANGVITKKKSIYLTDIEKARNWDGSSIAKIVREHLYPLAKIIFNSKEELQYGGHICNVIMKHISWDPEYERKTEEEKTNHKKEMWALWSGIVSKNLDTKRHNQKTMLRKAFYDWFDETYAEGQEFPSCDKLLRHDWYNEEPTLLAEDEAENITGNLNQDYIKMMLKMGKIVVGTDTWNTRGKGNGGDFEKMLLITDEVLIAWTLDGHYNGWCDQFAKRFVKRTGKPKGRRIALAGSDTSITTGTDEDQEETNAESNHMDKCKQKPSTDANDWLNYQRPLCGCWFIKKAMDAGFTSKNGGTTDQGKGRWNTWFHKILKRRLSKREGNQTEREHHKAFSKAFQDAWRLEYGAGAGKKGKNDGSGEKEKIVAFNGIMLTGV